MPCIVCGKATKENSIICNDCLQKEIHQKKGSAAPLKTTPAPPKKPASPKQKAKPASKPKTKNSTFSFDSLLDDIGDTLNTEDDLEFNPLETAKKKPVKPQQKMKASEADDLSVDINKMFTTDEPAAPTSKSKPTTIPEEPKSDITLDLDSDLSFEDTGTDGDISLDLDEPAKTITEDEPKPEQEENEIEQIDTTEIDADESDEDILKKKIKNRMQQKLTSMKPVEKKSDPMESLLDEVLLDEVEEIKAEEKQPKTLPTEPQSKKKVKKKISKAPVDKPIPEKTIKAKKKSPKEDDLLSEILKPKKTDKVDVSMSLSEGINAEKKEAATGFEKGKSAKGDSPFESTGGIIKGTTSKSKSRKKKEKSSKAFLWIILIIIILGAGGYAVYEFVLKKDPIKIELTQLLEKAKAEESNGNIQSAIGIYESIGPKYTKYPEAGNVPIKIKELRSKFEEMKKSSEFQDRINNLLAQAKKQFDNNQWTDGRGQTALSLYSEVLKLDSENAEAKNKITEMENSYLKNGSRALKQKKYSRAQKSFQKVLQINPENITASTYLTTIETIFEQQRANQQQNENRKREIKKQKDLAEQQKKEQQRLADAEARRKEANRIEQEKKAAENAQQQQQQNEMKNKVFIDALVDGGRRVYVKRVTAELPLSAKRTGIKGSVFVKVIVNNEGVPESVNVQKSDSEILSNAAMDAVRKYRYKPPTKNGVPCKMELTEIIKFR